MVAMNKTHNEMLAMITKENIHPEIKSCFSVGNEILHPYSQNDIDNKLEEVKQEH